VRCRNRKRNSVREPHPSGFNGNPESPREHVVALGELRPTRVGQVRVEAR
jgi:hypothetical protein